MTINHVIGSLLSGFAVKIYGAVIAVYVASEALTILNESLTRIAAALPN